MKWAGVIVMLALGVAGNAIAEDAPPPPAECIAPDQVNGRMTPVEIWHDIVACAYQDKYDNAVFLYAVAGAFARFDTLRVADKTAHQAAKALPIVAMGSLPEEEADALKAHVTQALGNDATRRKVCEDVDVLGPPTYFPAYMISHGADAAAGSNQPAFVPGVDAMHAWHQAVDGYLMCPAH